MVPFVMALRNTRAPSCFAGLVASALAAVAGPLDEYIAQPDPNYAWKVVRAERAPEGTFAVLHLASQSWRTGRDVDRTLWHHWLEVYVPAEVDHDVALLDISGGTSEMPSPEAPDGFLAETAIRLRAVTARVGNVPNQPLGFLADPEPARRREDQILAFAWARYLATGDPEWLTQLPMARSAVKAMDAVTEYCATGVTAAVAVKEGQTKMLLIHAEGGCRTCDANPSAAIPVTVVNYTPWPVHAAAVDPDASNLCARLGRPAGSPVRLIRGSDLAAGEHGAARARH
jgi:hypothetical protein